MTARPHILLVEDDPSHTALLQHWLGDSYELTCTDDGAAGLAAARRHTPDLVLSDIRLPGMSGLELQQHLATESRAPVLLMTSDADVRLAVQAIENGVSGYLIKPLTRQKLGDTIDKIMAASPPRRTVLAVGAHPDDVEIGVGGTLLRHVASGDRVVVLTLSSGASGGDPHARRVESEHAAQRLGATLHLGDLPDTRMEVGPSTIDAIAAVIRDVRPDVVYTHTRHDNHQDHRAVHHATIVAARGVRELYCYQSPSTTVGFQPATFVEIGDHLDAKLDALHAYTSQTSTRAYLTDDHIRATACYWGRFAGYGLVEPLEVVRAARST